jgi:predicted RNase H-like HicB family nuclease
MPANSGYIVLTFQFRKEGRRWIACCEELGTSTFGRSIPEAEKRIEEAVFLHLNTLEDVGERDRFFKDNSIRYYRSKPSADIRICAPVRKETFYKPHIQPIPALVN